MLTAADRAAKKAIETQARIFTGRCGAEYDDLVQEGWLGYVELGSLDQALRRQRVWLSYCGTFL